MSSERPARPSGSAGRHRQGDEVPSRRLATALDAYLRSQGHDEAWLFGAICGCWSAVVGAEVSAHATPRALRSGTLVVAVDHPGWATQLGFLGEQILAQLEQRVGRVAADRLKVTVTSRADVE